MWFVSAILALTTAIFLHAVLRRKFRTLNIVVSFVIAAGLSAIILTCWLVLRYGIITSQTWGAILIFCLMCEMFLFVTTLAMASISANCIVTLAVGRSGADVERVYDNKVMVGTRIDRLKAANFIAELPDGLTLTPAGRRIVLISGWLRRFFGHRQQQLRTQA